MRHTLLAVALVAALAGCDRAPPSAPVADAPADVAAPAVSAADTAFATLSARWLDEGLAFSPVSATGIGDHRFDAELDDVSAEGRHAALEWSRGVLAELAAIDATQLSRENQVDAKLLRNQLEYAIWDEEVFQRWAWDPQSYSSLAGGSLYSLVARDFAPWPERLRNATSRLEKLPAFLEQVRANLDPARVPRTHAETVARQNAGVAGIIDGYLLPHADELQGEERARLDAAIATARAALAAHQTWLDGTLVPNAKGDFRIGAELYDQQLHFALNSSLSRAEIKERATAEIERVRDEMYAVARTVLAGREGAPETPESPTGEQKQAAIEAALELAYDQPVGREELVDFAKSTLQVATDFVRAKDLVTVPDAPVQIIVMPEFQRGFSVAYADSPGPLDKGQNT